MKTEQELPKLKKPLPASQTLPVTKFKLMYTRVIQEQMEIPVKLR